jgi:hypothetical protein
MPEPRNEPPNVLILAAARSIRSIIERLQRGRVPADRRREARAARRILVVGDLAAEHPHDVGGDREAQAGAVAGAADERLEHVVGDLGDDPGAVVGHDEHDLGVARGDPRPRGAHTSAARGTPCS